MKYNLNEIKVLTAILKYARKHGLSKLNAPDVEDLLVEVTISKIYMKKIVKKLKENELIEEGIKKGKNKTYIITTLGMKTLQEIKTNIIDKKTDIKV